MVALLVALLAEWGLQEQQQGAREGHQMSRGDGAVAFEHQTGSTCRDEKQHRNCAGRWRGVVNRTVAGKRKRYVVDGATKKQASDRLKAKVAELDAGVRPDGRYTVSMCVADWLGTLDRQADKTRALYADMLRPVLASIGNKPLDRLGGQDVRAALVRMSQDHTDRAVQMAHQSLTRAIQRAMSHDLVGRNVAEAAERPRGKKEGRKSNAMTPAVAAQLYRWCTAEDTMIADYAIVAMLTGCRPEEGRALRWDHVDVAGSLIHVWRSVRATGDTKTPRSRRSIIVPEEVMAAVLRQQGRQEAQREAAADLWQDAGLVFTTEIGTEIDGHDMNRRFKRLCKRAGIGERWTVRECRHTFASLASANGANIDQIAQAMGHVTSRTTEQVYRQTLRPVPVGSGVTAAVLWELSA
jgi:integrase